MTINQSQLKKELKLAGADTSEINSLISIANNIPRLELNKKRFNFRSLKPIALVSVSFAIISIFFIYAQAVSPTNWLFPVQQFSDSLIIKIHPQYRANVMMQRAQQVNQLVASSASDTIILNTLKDYQSEANAYKNYSGNNYAAFEFCKTNLQTAASRANINIREAIYKSLNSLS